MQQHLSLRLVLCAWIETLIYGNPSLGPALTRLRPHVAESLDASLLVRHDPPEQLRTGASFIVCPGGNYESLDIHGSEGTAVAKWFNQQGITGFVLRYRLISEKHHWPAQFEDIELAVRMVREKAKASDSLLDASRVGVIGFSAGGHLASSAGTRGDPAWQPNLQILVYPTIDTMKPDWWKWNPAHGFPPPEHSTHLHVGPSTPPAFIVCSTQDAISSDHENCQPFALRLNASGVSFVHIVKAMGDHGFALQPAWTHSCEAWLTDHCWSAACLQQPDIKPRRDEV